MKPCNDCICSIFSLSLVESYKVKWFQFLPALKPCNCFGLYREALLPLETQIFTSRKPNMIWSWNLHQLTSLTKSQKAVEDHGCKSWGYVDCCLQRSFKNQNNSTRLQKEALKSMLVFLGKFQMSNQITAWQLHVVLGLALAVLVENGEALLWAVVFFHKRYGGVDTVRVVFSTITVYASGLSAGAQWWQIRSPKSLEERDTWKAENTSGALSTSSYHVVIWLATWNFLTTPA